MKKLAICYPTRNNASAIHELFEKSLSTYRDENIDVYIFDSSADNQTKIVVNEYISNGFSNLKYVSLPEEASLADKMEAILSRKYFDENYNYIWPVKDRTYFEKDSIESVYKRIEKKPDAILISPIKAFYESCDNLNQFYKDNAVYIASLETFIYSNTLLDDCNIKEIIDLIRDDQFRSWWGPYHCAFWALSKLENIHIEILGHGDISMLNTGGATMSWRKNIFEIAIDAWIWINENLPERYCSDRDSVIKDFGSLAEILGSIDKLIQLREDGILTQDTLVGCTKEKWERVSNVPYITLERIVYGSYDRFHDLETYKNRGLALADAVINLLDKIDDNSINVVHASIDSVVGGFNNIIIQSPLSVDVKYNMLGSMADMAELMKASRTVSEAKKVAQMMIGMILLVLKG